MRWYLQTRGDCRPVRPCWACREPLAPVPPEVRPSLKPPVRRRMIATAKPRLTITASI